MSREWTMIIVATESFVQLELREGPCIIASVQVENREVESALSWMSKLVRSTLVRGERPRG